MSNAALTDAELQEIKQRMGYGSMLKTALPYMATGLVFEDVVKANVNDYGIGWIRNTVLVQLRLIDAALGGDDLAFDRVVEVIGDVRLDPVQKMQLAKARKRYWLGELASTIRVKLASDTGADTAGGGGARIVLT